jgi:hypothetical protein
MEGTRGGVTEHPMTKGVEVVIDWLMEELEMAKRANCKVNHYELLYTRVSSEILQGLSARRSNDMTE